MHIRCEHCATEHELEPPAWVVSSGRSFRFRCASCGHSQMIGAPSAGRAPSGPAPTPGAVQPPTPRPEAPVAPDAAPVDSQVYLKQEGKVYLVGTWATLQQWIVERRVGREDLVSEGGVRWSPVGSRPELDSFFSAVDQLEGQAEPATDTPFPVGEPAFAAETPFGDEEAAPPPERYGTLPPDDDTEGVPVGLPPLQLTSLVSGSGLVAATPPPGEPEEPTPDNAPPQLYYEPGAPDVAPPQLLLDEEPEAPAVLDESDAFEEEEEEEPPLENLPTPAPLVVPRPSAPSVEAPRASEAPTPESATDRVAGPTFAPSGDTASGDLPVEPTGEVDAGDPFQGFGEADPGSQWATHPPPRRRRLLLPIAGAVTLIALLAAGVFAAAQHNAGEQPPKVPSTTPEASIGDVIAQPAPKVLADPPAEEAHPEAPPTPGVADPPAAEPPPPEPPAKEPPPETKAERVEPAKAADPRPAPAGPSAKSLIDRGWSAADKGDLDGSAKSFRAAIAKEAGNAEANYGLGYVLSEQGRAAEAKPYLCKALKAPAASVSTQREVQGVLTRNGLSCD